MDVSQFIAELSNLNIINYTIKGYFILVFTYYTFIKIINIKGIKKGKTLLSIILIIFIAIISSILNEKYNIYYCIISQVCFMIILNKINFKKDLLYTTSITIISLSISYILLAIAIAVSFIPNVFLGIKNDYVNLIILMLIYSLIICLVFKIKRIRNGFIFLQKKLSYEYFNILILNISVIVLFIAILNRDEMEQNLIIILFIFSIVMFITIKKSLELYYKQNLMLKELKETKKELEEKKKEIEELEKENLNFGKTSHTLAHKQRALEYKVNQLMKNSTEKEKADIKAEVDKLSKEIYVKPAMTEISKTGIPEIDDMLKYMQSEFEKYKIDFELQINGNIYHMINNLITKEELQILIADHVKDAIIAINHSDNINKSILVKLGEIDVYLIYDKITLKV